MSSVQLGSGFNIQKGNLGGAFDILSGASGDYTDLGIARRFGGAAAAYSLRDIGAVGGRVVKVRRDSDDTEEDFSANQVASGALETFVQDGAAYNEFSGDPVKAGAGSDAITLTKVSNTGFTAEISGASGTKQINFPLTSSLVSGDDYFVSFDYTSTSTSTVGVKPRTAALGSASNDVISATNSGFYGGTGDSQHNGFDVNNTATVLSFQTTANSFTFTVSNLRASRIARNGFVETWYDQSGSGNDATQGTAGQQPSIVQNGGIFKSNGSPSVFFTGDTRDDQLDFTDLTLTDATIFTVVNIDSSADQQIILGGGSVNTTTGTMIPMMDNGSSTTQVYKNATVGGAEQGSSQFKNGAQITLADRDDAFDNLAVDSQILFTMVDVDVAEAKVLDGISRTPSDALTFHMQGQMNELIIYNSNLSSERGTIESEIASHYGITLS